MTFFQIVQALYSVSAIGLWGAIAALAWRHARPTLALGAELVAALTRMVDTMKESAADAQTTREATARIESSCERIEHEVRELRVLVAARPAMASAHDEEKHSRKSTR